MCIEVRASCQARNPGTDQRWLESHATLTVEEEGKFDLCARGEELHALLPTKKALKKAELGARGSAGGRVAIAKEAASGWGGFFQPLEGLESKKRLKLWAASLSESAIVQEVLQAAPMTEELPLFSFCFSLLGERGGLHVA